MFLFQICSLHFLKSDFKIASEKWRLKPNAVPTIFAWTNKKPDSNIIKIPTYVPKANHEENISQETDEQCEKVQTINKNDSIPDVSEEKNMQNEDDHKNAESNVIQTSGKIYKEDNLKPEEYKSMYFNLLSENRYLKNELESLSYKYRDQEELYENLVVVNKTTEKENAEFRQTIALLQECLRNTVQKEVQVKGQLPTKLSAHFIKERIQDKTVVL